MTNTILSLIAIEEANFVILEKKNRKSRRILQKSAVEIYKEIPKRILEELDIRIVLELSKHFTNRFLLKKSNETAKRIS